MNQANQLDESRKPVTEHLEDLRKSIFRSVGLVLLFSLIAYLFIQPVLEWFIQPIESQIGQVYFFAPTEAFLIQLKLAVMVGIIFASPILFREIWTYIAPGLYQKEKKFLLPWVMVSTGLFVGGALFAFYIVLPLAMQFLMGFQTPYLKPMISVNHYVSFSISLMMAFAIAFNMPIFILISVMTGLVQVSSLVHYRKHAYVGVFILSMFLTPPDVISQLLLAGPLLVLYEGSILAAKIVSRRG